MSSAYAAKSQIPPFKYYKNISGGNVNLLTATGAAQNPARNVANNGVLRDMGKKVYLPGANSTLVKVQMIPITNSATESNEYLTGYISLGDDTLAATAVVAMN